MGACFSLNSSSKFKKNNVRVVHLNGYVEDFEQPIPVSKVIGNPSKNFVCTSIQLLSSSSNSTPLKGDTHLQPGQVYFMLPYSILEGDVSPVDLASLVKRLTSVAKTRPCEDNINNKSFKFHGRIGVAEEIGVTVMNGGTRNCKVQPWKPNLDTIGEKSFNRGSESDLQEYTIDVSKIL